MRYRTSNRVLRRTIVNLDASPFSRLQNGGGGARIPSKFTHGKKRVREDIDDMIAKSCEGAKLNDTEYRLVIRYTDDSELKKERFDELLHEIYRTADLRNCVVDDVSVKDEATGRYWDECDGGWRS